VFRLLSLCQATPADCLARLLGRQAFDEAHALAKQHGLNPDVVYQAHWRARSIGGVPVPTSPQLVAWLSPIRDRAWVLRELLAQLLVCVWMCGCMSGSVKECVHPCV
jgi:hypothetical protein